MSFNVNETYLKFQPFHEAMSNFQVGKWEDGFAKLAEVEQTFPTEPEVRAIRQEMEVRSRINEYEVEENKHQKRQQTTKTGFRILAIFVIVIIGFLAISTYSGWIEGQITKAQTDLSKNLLQAQLAVEFRNAQQLIIAGKSDEALSAYENIKAKNPDFPGLTDAITRAQALKDVEVQYTQAMNLLQPGDSAQALALLQEISRVMPNYRDVSLQIKNLQTQTQMASVMQQSDKAFLEGRYEDALSV